MFSLFIFVWMQMRSQKPLYELILLQINFLLIIYLVLINCLVINNWRLLDRLQHFPFPFFRARPRTLAGLHRGCTELGNCRRNSEQDAPSCFPGAQQSQQSSCRIFEPLDASINRAHKGMIKKTNGRYNNNNNNYDRQFIGRSNAAIPLQGHHDNSSTDISSTDISSTDISSTITSLLK